MRLKNKSQTSFLFVLLRPQWNALLCEQVIKFRHGTSTDVYAPLEKDIQTPSTMMGETQVTSAMQNLTTRNSYVKILLRASYLVELK